MAALCSAAAERCALREPRSLLGGRVPIKPGSLKPGRSLKTHFTSRPAPTSCVLNGAPFVPTQLPSVPSNPPLSGQDVV